MEGNEILLACAISLACGFGSCWLFFHNQRNREKKIRQKIANLDYQEKLLNNINNGYKNLLRHAFKTISFSFFLVFTSTASIFLVEYFPFPKFVVNFVWLFSCSMWSAAGIVNLLLFKNLVELNNVKGATRKIAIKREKLNKEIKT